ncbi:ABC transporter permease [Nocardioides sp. LHG3406-4]|uniref:ABC transporter permease n=1 Tax=Nocardioides sp. LHG3406-4 TaxID=2804575 RepID=UPI003CEBA58B
MSLTRSSATREPNKTVKPAPTQLEMWSGTPVRGIIPLVLALVVWQLIGDKESPYFPPPSEWYSATKPLMDQDLLLPALGATTLTFLLGLAIATLIGAVVGSLVGSSRLADRALGPTLEFLRILPAASLVPIAALILGYTMQMKLVVVVIPALWPILLACRTARRSINPVLLDVPRTLGLTRLEGLFKVTVPSMLRPVLLGVRVAAPLALIITILVEIVTRIDGLGALLGAAQSNYASAQVYGLLLIAGLLGFLVNWVVTKLDFAVSRRMGN